MQNSEIFYPVYYVDVIKESDCRILKERKYFRTPNDCSSYVVALLNDYDSELRANPLFTPKLKFIFNNAWIGYKKFIKIFNV